MTTYKKVGRQRMSDAKKYPTRMHEVLGVEPYERFSVSSTTPWHGRWLFVDERGDLREEGVKPPFDRAAVFLVNHPECIIRKPRLTQEQVKQLKALVTLGYRWLVEERNGVTVAVNHEVKKGEVKWLLIKPRDLDDVVCDVHQSLSIKGLVSWSDADPLDIVQTLRDAGVEVEG